MKKLGKTSKRKIGTPGRARKAGSWEEFFRMRDAMVKADPRAFGEFMADRQDEPP